MADDELNDDSDPLEQAMKDESNPLRSVVRDLEKQIKGKDKALNTANERIEKLAVVERETVFKEAGIPDEGPAKFFRANYQGDLTAEAIKAAALEHGFITPPSDPDTDAGLNAGDGIAETTGGQQPAGPDIGQLIRDAETPEQVAEIMSNAGLSSAPQ